MKKCIEFSIFRVAKKDSPQAIKLSHAMFSEMNAGREVITMSRVLVKTDNPEEICWHLEWVDELAAKRAIAKWEILASTSAFHALTVKSVYWAHFFDSVLE